MKIDVGAHLITSRGIYSHHGIYAGDGKVIHYSGLGDGSSIGPVTITTIDDFCNGNGFSVRRYNSQKYVGQEIVDRARSRLGEDEYNLLSNNCEHFCVWATTGVSSSTQVDLASELGAAIASDLIREGQAGSAFWSLIARMGAKKTVVFVSERLLPHVPEQIVTGTARILKALAYTRR